MPATPSPENAPALRPRVALGNIFPPKTLDGVIDSATYESLGWLAAYPEGCIETDPSSAQPTGVYSGATPPHADTLPYWDFDFVGQQLIGIMPSPIPVSRPNVSDTSACMHDSFSEEPEVVGAEGQPDDEAARPSDVAWLTAGPEDQLFGSAVTQGGYTPTGVTPPSPVELARALTERKKQGIDLRDDIRDGIELPIHTGNHAYSPLPSTGQEQVPGGSLEDAEKERLERIRALHARVAATIGAGIGWQSSYDILDEVKSLLRTDLGAESEENLPPSRSAAARTSWCPRAN